MSQANLEADVTAISAALTSVQGTLTYVATQAGSLVTDVTAIKAELAAGGTVSLASLDALTTKAGALQAQATAAGSSLDPAVASVSALVTPPVTGA